MDSNASKPHDLRQYSGKKKEPTPWTCARNKDKDMSITWQTIDKVLECLDFCLEFVNENENDIILFEGTADVHSILEFLKGEAKERNQHIFKRLYMSKYKKDCLTR